MALLDPLRRTRRRAFDAVRRRIGDSRWGRSRLCRRLASVDRLHVGCGANWVDGWLNVGLLDPGGHPYGSLQRHHGALVLRLDLTLGLPIPEAALRYVYGSHFIEHLAFPQALAFLGECRRALRPGGRIRLTCPDLELWARRYLEDDRDFLERYAELTRERREDQGLPPPRTRGQIMMSQVHGWGHRWAYDEESLRDLLERTGFGEVSRRDHHRSALPDVELLEPSTPTRLLETLYVEAVRR